MYGVVIIVGANVVLIYIYWFYYDLLDIYTPICGVISVRLTRNCPERATLCQFYALFPPTPLT